MRCPHCGSTELSPFSWPDEKVTCFGCRKVISKKELVES